MRFIIRGLNMIARFFLCLAHMLDPHADLRKESEAFYCEQFGFEVDFSDVVIPSKPKDGSWILLFVAAGMTTEKVFAQCSQLFRCWKYTDNLDAASSVNTRTTEESYAIWVRDGVESDEEFVNKPICEVDPDMKNGMTLTERLLLEIRYFLKTEKHLDVRGTTFCSATRYVDDSTPGVYWGPYDGRMGMYCSIISSSHTKGGIRQAVSA